MTEFPEKSVKQIPKCNRDAFHRVPIAPIKFGTRWNASLAASKAGSLGAYPLLSLCAFILLPATLIGAPELELTNAVVVFPSNLSGPERKAVTMLVEEVEKRTRIRWPELTAWPAAGSLAVPVIALGPKSQL